MVRCWVGWPKSKGISAKADSMAMSGMGGNKTHGSAKPSPWALSQSPKRLPEPSPKRLPEANTSDEAAVRKARRIKVGRQGRARWKPALQDSLCHACIGDCLDRQG